ncbi:MAG: hypothetical protein JRE57_00105 [Deltaproteobacteria bacterium]|nr:hypothetical protein [Deltaproteobacteria bacterium]
MATEFNYVANIDTTRIMGAVAEIRSQLGMALGSATGFGSPAAGIVGGGAGGGGAPYAAQQMLAGFGNFTPSMFGGTFTNSAMAYTPHYGMMQAQSTFAQERQIHQGGLAAAARAAPPGVAAADHFMAIESNLINRQIDAKHQAQFAASSTFYSGAGGLMAGVGADMLAAPIGAYAGGKIASRLFGGGAAGAGKFVGGLAAGWMAFDWAMDEVGGDIQEHFANVERIGGVTKELGEIAGAGRGLGRTKRYDLGVAARGAAGDLKMDVQEMGDILSIGRNMGMLPGSTDPSKARDQFREFAQAVDEGAQILKTSLSGAAQVIKSATSHGMTAQEGVIKAAAMGGPGAFNRYMAFGDSGGRMAEANLLSREQGFGLFTGAVGAASGAGLSGAEMRMMGGRYGAAGVIGQTQMAAALSPMGDMQLMAAMTGEGLGGMMDLPGQAMQAMGEGGDFIGNAIRFQTHKREMMRGVGAKGIRTMARNQLQGVADILQDLSPSLSGNDAQRFAAMQMYGLNEVQAKTYVGGLSGGGGGGGLGGAGAGRALVAMQGAMLGDVSPSALGGGGGGGPDTTNSMITGAMLGAMAPGPFALPGAALGAAVGYAYSKWDSISNFFSGDSPPLFDSAEKKADFYQRKQAQEYDQSMATAKARVGYLDLDQGVASQVYRADLGGTRLNLDAMGSPMASQRTRGALLAAGLKTVGAGAGTVRVGGEYFDATEAQEIFQGLGKKTTALTDDQEREVLGVAANAATATGGRAKAREFANAYAVATGDIPAWANDPTMTRLASDRLLKLGGELVEIGGGSDALREEMSRSGVGGDLFRKLVKDVTGKALPALNEEYHAGVAVTGGAQGADRLAASRTRAFIRDATGGVTRSDESFESLGGQSLNNFWLSDAKKEVKKIKRQYANRTGIVWEETGRSSGEITRERKESKSETEAARVKYESDLSEAEGRVDYFEQGASSLYEQKLESSEYYGRFFDAVNARKGLTGEDLAEKKEQARRLWISVEDDARRHLPEGASVRRMDIDERIMRRQSTLGIGALVRTGDSFARALGMSGAGVSAEEHSSRKAGVESISQGIGGVFSGVFGDAAGKTVQEAAKKALGSASEQSLPDRLSKTSLKGLTTSFVEEILKPTGGTPKKKRKRSSGGGTLQRAVGWGSRESAMDSINRSIKNTDKSVRRTRDMVEDLDKRMKGVEK